MGKPNARRFGMQLTTCRKFVYTISTIVEHNFPDHLIEPVGNSFQKAIRILLDIAVTIGGVKYGTEG